MQTAGILIHDINGNQVSALKIEQKGFGEHELNASSLAAGTYLYSLVIDGEKKDTKKKILTD